MRVIVIACGVLLLGVFVLLYKHAIQHPQQQIVHSAIIAPQAAPTVVVIDPPVPEGYHLVIYQEGNKKYYGIEFCSETGCHLFGYRYPMSQLKAATATYNWFANRQEREVVSVVK